jgi:hypothetical protein
MSEIMHDFLYLGSLNDACTPSILNELKITHLVNLSLTRIIPGQSFEIIHFPLHDKLDENITKYFEESNKFIDECHKQTNGRCLVFCKHGRSRSVASMFKQIFKKKRKCFYYSCNCLFDQTSWS